MKRRKFSNKFKTQVVLEVLSERYTLSEIAQKHKIHPNQAGLWKRQFLENAESVFDKGVKSPEQRSDEEKDKLLKMIGQQKVEIDFLKNALR